VWDSAQITLSQQERTNVVLLSEIKPSPSKNAPMLRFLASLLLDRLLHGAEEFKGY